MNYFCSDSEGTRTSHVAITALPRTYGTYAIYRFCTLCNLRRRDHILAVHACLATYIGRSWPYKGKWLAGWLGGWLPVISPVTIRRRGPATNGL